MNTFRYYLVFPVYSAHVIFNALTKTDFLFQKIIAAVVLNSLIYSVGLIAGIWNKI